MTTPSDIIHAMATRSMKKLRVAMILPGGVFSYLAAKKRVKMEDGGPDIENPLLIGGNPNVGPASYYDRVPVSRTSELTTVKHKLTRVVGTYVISDQEIDENAGASKIVDIAASKMQALEISFKQYQRSRAVGTNTGKDINGLGNLFPAVNTAGSVGGINLASQPLFRHEVYSFGGSVTVSNIEDTFDDMILDLNNEEGKITVIFAGRNIFNMHRTAAKDKVQVQLGAKGFGQTIANLGLVSTMHVDIPVIYDELLDPNIAYFINENEVMMHILSNANMKMKDLTAPYDQDVVGKRYIHEYQLCSWKMHRTHAFFDNRP